MVKKTYHAAVPLNWGPPRVRVEGVLCGVPCEIYILKPAGLV